ncbi:aminotransferase class I/II-fold pyridoxal phosphate-dependent enzyme [Planosporangium thailandense]|uniref:Aminotransferase class I/II-fold pyridoxal phosphate-dependent enzyme n=1 Tax=Planosporangium thailandense TaxID=765197 RepID=A0ABX0XR37_9ACTN|nr:aminotransferase class I/II-fold pyridoxal phosphate-dependent enzyme [Planosporangium thailandense]
MSAHYQIAGSTAAEIAVSVEAGVRGGHLEAGAALPPVRGLAATLGVSPATVAAAYRTLRERGVIETAGRAGTRVRARPPLQPRHARRPPVPAGVLDLSAGEPDPRLLPSLRAALSRVNGDPVGYAASGPLPELLNLARERLAPVTAPALTITGGALDGIERALTAHLRPGDRVAVEDPGWANLLDLIAALGLSPVPVSVDDDGPTPARLGAALASGVGAVVVTTRAQNPTGAAVGQERAAALRALLGRYPDVLVVEDDHAAELSPVGLHPLAGATGSWVFIRSVSKPYGPDLRLAVVAGDEATVARIEGRMRVGAGWVSTVLQRLVLELWRDPSMPALIRAAADSYAARREALLAALRSRGLAAAGRTGINVWVPVGDETAALARLRDDGYAVAPGSAFRVDTPPGLRITISPLDLAQVEPLADAVLRAVHPEPGARSA